MTSPLYGAARGSRPHKLIRSCLVVAIAFALPAGAAGIVPPASEEPTPTATPSSGVADTGADAGARPDGDGAGRVLAVGDLGAYGRIVLIDHGKGVATLIGHLSDILVRPGSNLARGETVGRVGCTGLCTGPHVHFSVFARRQPKDPILWLHQLVQ